MLYFNIELCKFLSNYYQIYIIPYKMERANENETGTWR